MSELQINLSAYGGPWWGGFVIAGPPIIITFIVIYFTIIKPRMQYSRLLKTGIRAMGTVVKITGGGKRSYGDRLYKIELEIEIPGKPVYTTVVKKVMGYFWAQNFQPGAKIPLLVDSLNNKKVVLVAPEDLHKAGKWP